MVELVVELLDSSIVLTLVSVNKVAFAFEIVL